MSAAVLNNWALVGKRNSDSTGAAVEIRLRGMVFGHASHPDGCEITTSRIKHRRGEELVTINGTHYILGSVNPEYDARFPNAKAALLGRLPEIENEETIAHMRPPESA